VKARGLKIDITAFEYFNASWANLGVISNLGTGALWGLKKNDTITGTGQDAKKYSIEDVVEGLVTQQPMHVVEAKYIVNQQKLMELMADAWVDMPKNWKVENEKDFHLKPANDANGNQREDVDPSYELCEEPSARPYAVLDYLALHKREELNKVVVNTTTKSPLGVKNYDLNTHYNDLSFPAQYRSLIMAANQIMHQNALADQKLYFSDAEDDCSLAKYRFTLNPQIDHIIPVRSPNRKRKSDDSHKDGPTLFSNARLTSASYNGSKSNTIPAGLKVVQLGTVNQRTGTAQGAKRQKTDNPKYADFDMST
jgi:hypothetical protein